MGKPNFNFQKRQRELAKKKKKEEKKLRKLEKSGTEPEANHNPDQDQPAVEGVVETEPRSETAAE